MERNAHQSVDYSKVNLSHRVESAGVDRRIEFAKVCAEYSFCERPLRRSARIKRRTHICHERHHAIRINLENVRVIKYVYVKELEPKGYVRLSSFCRSYRSVDRS